MLSANTPTVILTLALAVIHTTNAQMGQTTTVSAPAYVDSTFYTNNPAPAPGACPNGDSTATLSDENSEGPYYVDEKLLRSDVTENEAGVPLEVRITVLDTDCVPVVTAFVDIWQCNATGIYSGYLASQQDPGGSTSSRKMLQTGNDNSTFLRGTVLTDSNGVASFTSIFPGWYAGRAVHIHTMLHMPTTDISSDNEMSVYDNATYISHTGRIFFEPSLVQEINQLSPYSRHQGIVTSIEEDNTYTGDDRTLATITRRNATDLSAGLVASVTQIVNRTAVYTEGSEGGLGGGGMPGAGELGGSMGPLPGMGVSGGMALAPGAMGGMPGGGASSGMTMLTLPQSTGRKILSNQS